MKMNLNEIKELRDITNLELSHFEFEDEDVYLFKNTRIGYFEFWNSKFTDLFKEKIESMKYGCIVN